MGLADHQFMDSGEGSIRRDDGKLARHIFFDRGVLQTMVNGSIHDLLGDQTHRLFFQRDRKNVRMIPGKDLSGLFEGLFRVNRLHRINHHVLRHSLGPDDLC